MVKKLQNKDVIVLNRMYAGNYLSANIGHEVINLFKADNGNHYLYLNATGDFDKKYEGRIKYMLLTKYHTEGMVEIIGLATGLEDVYTPTNRSKDKNVVDDKILAAQKAFCDREGGVKYGGVSIFDIFKSGQQSIYITFKAKKLFKPTERFFLQFPQSEKANKDPNCITIKGYNIALTSLKQYFELTNDDTKNADYKNLTDIINTPSRWEEWSDSETKIDINSISDVDHPTSLFDICQIQENENCFSNALAYFMRQEKYFPIWMLFFQKYGILLDQKEFSVNREENTKFDGQKDTEGYIDIVLRDTNTIIVIENKIKSGINKKESDKKNDINQLDRYYKYVMWLTNKKDTSKDLGKTSRFFILVPNYNLIAYNELNEHYTIIKYKDLYNYLDKYKDLFANDQNFSAFFNAIKRHTYLTSADYLYNDMKDRFFKSILEQRKGK